MGGHTLSCNELHSHNYSYHTKNYILFLHWGHGWLGMRLACKTSIQKLLGM